jgi:hypothetical protein
MGRLHAATRSLKDGFVRLIPRTWGDAAQAGTVLALAVAAVVGISHWVFRGEATPFVDRVDRICFDAARRYQDASGPSTAAAQERAAIAADVVAKMRRLSAPADELLDYDSLVVDKTRIANLRDQIYRAKRGGRTTRRLSARLLNEQTAEQTAVQYEMQDLGLRVCGRLKPELE